MALQFCLDLAQARVNIDHRKALVHHLADPGVEQFAIRQELGQNMALTQTADRDVAFDDRDLRDAVSAHQGECGAQRFVRCDEYQFLRRRSVLGLGDQPGGDTLWFEQELFLHPLVRVEFAQIMFACVADDEYDHAALVQIFRDLQRPRKISPCRAAAEDALAA